MSIFANYYTEVVALPMDAPHTVTIQKLSGRDVERAQANAAAAIVSGRGFAEKIRKMLAASAGDAAVQTAMADPLNGFDRHTLLITGITGWSYTDDDGPLKVTPEAIGRIDDEASELLARAILKLTKPALFEPVEDARKNA